MAVESDNDKSSKSKASGWDRVEKAGDSVELGARLFMSIVTIVFLCSAAYAAGSWIWSGIGVMMAIVTFPIAAVIGFFLPEIKLFCQLLLRLVFGAFLDG